MRCAISMARPRPPVSPCAPWLWSGISTPMGLARAATTRRGARRSTTSMASSITPTGSTTCSSPPPWEGGNYEPRNPMESGFLRRRDPRSIGENNIGNALSIMTISPPIHCGAPDKVALCTCLARVAQALPVISLGVPFSPQQLAEGDQRRVRDSALQRHPPWGDAHLLDVSGVATGDGKIRQADRLAFQCLGPRYTSDTNANVGPKLSPNGLSHGYGALLAHSAMLLQHL